MAAIFSLELVKKDVNQKLENSVHDKIRIQSKISPGTMCARNKCLEVILAAQTQEKMLMNQVKKLNILAFRTRFSA